MVTIIISGDDGDIVNGETNPKSVEDYKAGKTKALGFLVGQIMKQSRGQANPAVINRLLVEKLNSM